MPVPTANSKRDKKTDAGSDLQQRRGNVNRRMCRLACRPVPQQPPSEPSEAQVGEKGAGVWGRGEEGGRSGGRGQLEK